MLNAFKNNKPSKEEQYPLHYAAYTGNLSALKNLLNENNVNSLDPDLETPLHLAVIYQHEQCVAALLEAGADVTLTRPRQLPERRWIHETALDLAMSRSNQNIVNLITVATQNATAEKKKNSR